MAVASLQDIELYESQEAGKQIKPDVFGAPYDGAGLSPSIATAAWKGGGPSLEDSSDTLKADKHGGADTCPSPLSARTHQIAQKWTLALFIASNLDILGSTTIMSVAFSYGYRDGGVSLYCLGMQACSHAISSLALCFRFYGELWPEHLEENGEDCFLHQKERRDSVREQAFGISMGLALLVSSAALLFKALRKLKFWDVWYLDHANLDEEAESITDFLAWSGFCFYSLQAVVRWIGAKKLKHGLVKHSCTVSIVTLVFLLVLAIAASYERQWSWKAEPIAAIVLVVVALVEGIRLIILNLGDVDEQLKQQSK